ncbi:cyclin-T1-4 isoform X1 [Cryptomeria japonica]|uniref:cyclin-T1-4 isoform X1 n=1 Tax=Cryptomeria japonica TaxID=3369 RepID=UPI0025ACEC91|nr:cyclin-T1-4 isoform X1 [Cryptomeria japonica]XP_057821653.1 cyclin-T1-4 isoform X1 [Cryptomeria japonica]
MEHARGYNHLPIRNGNNILRPSSIYERVPLVIRNEGQFQNTARNLTRKFQESFYGAGCYDSGPASKRRREVYLSNPLSFDNHLPFARRFEDGICNSWGINNYSTFTGRTEESYCNRISFNSNSILSWRHEEKLSDVVNSNSGNMLTKNDEFMTGVGNNSDGFDHYLSREEIERCSPSRRDGIDLQKETYYRYSYCAFLQTLGMRMQLPQTTIASAMVFCHRFFLRHSHATHDRFLIATAALFLAAKSEETPRPLNSLLFVSYEICHKHELENFHHLLPIDWFEQYKQRVLEAEQMVLTTLDFELTIEHPYNPLMSVLNKIGLAQTVLVHVAWNLVSEGDFLGCMQIFICTIRLRSSLCLQFKPQHIAAGATFLAAKFLNFNLSSNQCLYQEFQTTPTILQDVVQQLTELF